MTREQIVKQKYGDFKYTELKNGYIMIDDSWVKENIVKIDLPIIGTVHCHKLIAGDLAKVFGAIESNGDDIALIDIRDTQRYGGCWVARHQLFNTTKPLSLHSWGIAIDVNPSANGYNKPPTPSQMLLAKYFKENNFMWGGDWQTPDGMHFEHL